MVRETEIFRNLTNSDQTSSRFVESVVNGPPRSSAPSRSGSAYCRRKRRPTPSPSSPTRTTPPSLSLGQGGGQAGMMANQPGHPANDDWENGAGADRHPRQHGARWSASRLEVFNLTVPARGRAPPRRSSRPSSSAATKFCRDHRAFLIVDIPPDVGRRRAATSTRTADDWMTARRRPARPTTPPSTSRACASPTRSTRTGRATSARAARSPASTPAPTPRAASGRRRPAPTPGCAASRAWSCSITDLENGDAQPARHQRPAHLPDLRQRRLGRAHARRRRPAGQRVEVHPGAAHGAVHRGEPVPGPEVGGLRAERRAALGADPAQRRRVHATACSARARSRARPPREAYFVKCDKETTTQNDINRGIVNILVGFAPLKPAEFVIIKIQQIAGQIAA